MYPTPEQIARLKARGVSDEAIAAYFGNKLQTPTTVTPAEPKSAGQFITEKVPESAGRLVSDTIKGVVNVFNPNLEENTLANLARLGVGAGLKLIPGEQAPKSEQMASAAADYFRQRYGSASAAGEALYQDPVGVISDAAALLTGAGAAIRTTGTVSRVGQVSKVGQKVMDVGSAIDPTTAITRATGSLVERGTTGRSISLPGAASRVNRENIQAAERLGIDQRSLPASAVNDSRIVSAMEAAAAKGFFGNKIDKTLMESMTKLNTAADRISARIGANKPWSEIGEKILGDFDSYKAQFFREKDKLYEKVNQVLDSNDLKDFDVSKTLNEIKVAVNARKESAQFTDISKDTLVKLADLGNKLSDTAISGKQIKKPPVKTLKSMRQLLQRLNEIADPGAKTPISHGEQGTYRRIAQQLSEDIDAYITKLSETSDRPELRELRGNLDLANSFFTENMKLFDSGVVDYFAKNRQDPSKIVKFFTEPSRTIEDLQRAAKIIGEENMPSLRKALVEEFFSKARNADGEFTPLGLYNELKKVRPEKLKVLFTEEQISELNDIATVAKSLGPIKASLTGSQTAFIQRVIGLTALLGGSLSLAGLMGPVSVLLGDSLFTKFIDSDIGQKFLRGELKLTGALGRKIKENADTVGRGAMITRETEQVTDEQNDNTAIPTNQ